MERLEAESFWNPEVRVFCFVFFKAKTGQTCRIECGQGKY